jgi:hypothetical protein
VITSGVLSVTMNESAAIASARTGAGMSVAIRATAGWGAGRAGGRGVPAQAAVARRRSATVVGRTTGRVEPCSMC